MHRGDPARRGPGAHRAAGRARARRSDGPGRPRPSPGTVSRRARNGAAGADTGSPRRAAATPGSDLPIKIRAVSWSRTVSVVTGGRLSRTGAGVRALGPGLIRWSGPGPWSCGPRGGCGPGSVRAGGAVRAGRGRARGARAGPGAASRSASSRACSSRPGASNGSRRRRCGRASRAARRMSSSVTSSRPCQAASAIAVRAVTRSARMPSTPNAPQTAQIWRSAASGSVDLRQPGPGRGHVRRPARRYRRRSGPRTRRGRPRRRAGGGPPRPVRPGLGWPSPRTVSPKRSSSCGRSSPSSGFIVPTSRKREACRTETPSRST